MSDKLERMLKTYTRIRDKRAQNKRVWEDLDGKLKDQMELIEKGLLLMMNETGSDQLKVKGVGMAILTTRTLPRARDWNAIFEFVQDTGNFDLLQKRLAMGGVNEYIEQHRETPPGIDVTVERGVSVRRA